MAKKKAKRKSKPQGKARAMQLFKARMIAEGKQDKFKEQYNDYINSYGLEHNEAYNRAMADFGYTTYQDEVALAAMRKPLKQPEDRDTKAIQIQLQELIEQSNDVEYDVEESMLWVASVVNDIEVMPMDAPHVIAWNLLQAARDAKLAFYKDFLLKQIDALKRHRESLSNTLEDERDLTELRQSVQEAMDGYGEYQDEEPDLVATSEDGS